MPKADSRAALLAAARQLFATRGYTTTGISDIVALAGTSIGLLYYHFGSKKKIFLALWDAYQNAQEARTRAAVAVARRRGVTDGGELLLTAIRAYLDGAWEVRDLQLVMHGTDRPPGFDAALEEANGRWFRLNRPLLAWPNPDVTRAVSLTLMSSVGAVCLRFPNCKTEAEARVLMDTSLTLWAAVIDRARTLSESRGALRDGRVRRTVTASRGRRPVTAR